MTSPTPDDLDALAKGLTKAQRNNLLAGKRVDGHIFEWEELFIKKLATRNHRKPFLTPLGLRLRAHLEKNDG